MVTVGEKVGRGAKVGTFMQLLVLSITLAKFIDFPALDVSNSDFPALDVSNSDFPALEASTPDFPAFDESTFDFPDFDPEHSSPVR